MTDLVEFLRFLNARLDEDEWWAREASRDGGNPVPATGHHWQWVDGDTDKVITPDPAASEYLEDLEDPEGISRLSLRSVETYPVEVLTSKLPHFAIHTAEEIPAPVGGHIARHDPARVLREVEAKRQMVERCERELRSYVGTGAQAAMPYLVLRLLALPYADHPDYQQEWRP